MTASQIAAESQPPGGDSVLRHFRGGWGAYLLLSLLLLAPCYWQPIAHGGDLEHYMSNAWLPRYIETGASSGHVTVDQSSYVLFGLMRESLNHIVGAEFALRFSVSITVLILIWGAFAFVGAVSGRRPWHLLASIAMLAYGWDFHMGFYGFCLSLGLCFWALSLAWESKPRTAPAAAALLALAFTASALPVAWTLLLLGYVWAARRVSAARRAYVIAAGVPLLALTLLAVRSTGLTQASPQQLAVTAGAADQVWTFGSKYYLVLAGLLALWSTLFLDLLHRRGIRDVVTGIPFQLCIMAAAAVFALPITTKIPGLHHALVFVGERMSLGVAVCVCALLGAAPPRKIERYGLVAVALAFFSLIYIDERAQNSAVERMQGNVARFSAPSMPAGFQPARILMANRKADVR